MRGKRLIVASPFKCDRITPADAGKTETVKGIPAAEEDHPRGCGENNMDKTRIAVRAGSPPRMRGKRL